MDELLHVNTQPCLLFILWPNTPSVVVEDAFQLSFAILAEKWIEDLALFMEAVALDDWDSAPATKLHSWYDGALKRLKASDQNTFLFDPTVLLSQLLVHLHSSILARHCYDITKQQERKSLLIPLEFIRVWKHELLKEMKRDLGILRELMDIHPT